MESKYLKYLLNVKEISSVCIAEDKINNDIEEAYRFTYLDDDFYIKFYKAFPGELPKFYMIHPKPLLHVAEWGEICIERIEDIDFDILDTESIIISAFLSFFNIINQSKPGQDDYLSEYGDYVKYFKKYNSDQKGYLFDGIVLDQIQMIKRYTAKKTQYFTSMELPSKNIVPVDLTKLTLDYSIYIPLDKAFEIKDIGSKLYLSDITKCINEQSKIEMQCLLKKHLTKQIVVSIKNINGYLMVFSIIFEKKIENIDLDLEVISINQIKSLDIKYLKERGSANHKESKILIIGLGSIGSEILYHICKSGYDFVDICDFDYLEPNNTYRHFLGYFHAIPSDGKDINHEFKTTLLKYEMQKRYPSVEIKAFNKSIERLLNGNEVDLNEYDYIINSTGNMISNKILNKYLYQNSIKTKVIYTWLEPFGVALHFFIANTLKKGCINCLLNSINNVRLSENDDYVIQNDNCLGSFTRFGSIAISRLALEVVDILLKDDFTTNKHLLIKGDYSDFLKAGYQLSKYKDYSIDLINELGKDVIYEGCPICGNYDT